MSLGKVPMKGCGGAKQNASLELGTQVSRATQRAATTTRQRHTEKLTVDTLIPTSMLTKDNQEGENERGKMTHKCMIWSSKLQDLPERICVI